MFYNFINIYYTFNFIKISNIKINIWIFKQIVFFIYYIYYLVLKEINNKSFQFINLSYID